MTIDFSVLKEHLYEWVITVIPPGMPAIYWKLNAPRPNVPYITLQIASVVSVGQDWTEPETDASGSQDMKGDRQFTFSIQAYGGDPLTILENIRTSLQKQSVLDTLRANGIAFYQALNIADITELVDSQFERRASLDVLFGIGQIYADNPGFFETVEVDETIFNEVGNIVYDEKLIISVP